MAHSFRIQKNNMDSRTHLHLAIENAATVGVHYFLTKVLLNKL